MIPSFFPGKRPYRREDSEFFFPVPSQLSGLLDRLALHQRVLLVGPEGIGKTSLMEAGLPDALEQGLLVGATTRWTFLSLDLRTNPLDDLVDALMKTFPGFDHLDTKNGLKSSLLHDPMALRDHLRRVMPRNHNILIMVDDLEDLLRKDSVQDVLLIIDRLLALKDDGRQFFVVFAAGIEVLNECSRFPSLAELVNTSLYFLSHPDIRHVKSVIEAPFRMMGHEIEDERVAHWARDIVEKNRPWDVYQSLVPEYFRKGDASNSVGKAEIHG